MTGSKAIRPTVRLCQLMLLLFSGCVSVGRFWSREDATRETSALRTVLLEQGFSNTREEGLQIARLVYPWSWYNDMEHDNSSGLPLFRFSSCDDLASIAKYYVDTLYGLGWRRSRSFPSSGDPEWCGEFTNAVGQQFFVRVDGPWSVGVMSRDGVVAVDGDLFVEHSIVVAVTGTEPESVLGRDFRKKAITADQLSNHLTTGAEVDPNSCLRIQGDPGRGKGATIFDEISRYEALLLDYERDWHKSAQRTSVDLPGTDK